MVRPGVTHGTETTVGVVLLDKKRTGDCRLWTATPTALRVAGTTSNGLGAAVAPLLGRGLYTMTIDFKLSSFPSTVDTMREGIPNLGALQDSDPFGCSRYFHQEVRNRLES